MLEIYAGDTALKTIQERGFSQELFNTFLGASGGPKWTSIKTNENKRKMEIIKARNLNEKTIPTMMSNEQKG